MFQAIQKEQQQDAGPVQAKLEVGREDDVQEKEADHVADKVMRMSSGDGDSTMPAGNIRKMPSPEIKKMPQPLVRKMPAAPASPFRVSPSVEKGISSSKGAGQKLDNAVQEEMSSKIGSDFSEVNVHTNAHAQQMSREIGAKAFTHGNDIYFNQGQYNPSSEQGKHLLAHELTHTVQQSGNVQKKVQRSALASWEDATPTDQKELFDSEAGEKEKKNYAKQETARQTIATLEKKTELTKDDQKELDRSKKIIASATEKGQIVALPVIDKIMKISANYHYQKETPSPDPGKPFVFTKEVEDEVQTRLRMINSHPSFWPHIKWLDHTGALRDIGVRLDIRFIEEAGPKGAQQTEDDGMPSHLKDLNSVRENPWDNEFTFTTIDRIQNYAYFELETFVTDNGLKNIKFTKNDKDIDIVEYTPEGGEKIVYGSEQNFEIKQAIRKEWVAQKKPSGKDAPINNNVLGLGNSDMVKVDPRKTAPTVSAPFQKYEKYRQFDSEGYYDGYEDRFKETTTRKYTDAERNVMLANVIIHEIGHNIGMAHSDFGLMNKEADQLRYVSTQTSLGGFQEQDAMMKHNTTSVQAAEISLEPSDADIIPANIQKLVNRVKIMTESLTPRDKTTGIQEDVSGLWSSKLGLLRTALKESNYAAIFDDPFLVSVLAIPYDGKGVGEDDAKTIAAVQKKGFLMTLEDWNKLSGPLKESITKETLSIFTGSGTGTGHTFFESKEAMNTF